jgi:glucose/mannose-6-phosphate isomerase
MTNGLMSGAGDRGGSGTSGGILDDAPTLARVDASGMLANIAAMPMQLEHSWELSRALELPDSHRAARNVAVLGMGGSAIGGDLVRGIWADRLSVPLEVVRSYDLPAWVSSDSLVVASSYSGATEETISALTAAVQRGARVAVISTGGLIHDVAQRADLPLLTFPGGGQPRAAVGYAMGLLAGLLERAGMLALDEAEVAAAARAGRAAVAMYGPAVPTADDPAKQLAWTLLDRLPIIEASGFLSAVARRWKTQLNENGKSSAVWEELPEATHNAVVGYPQPEAVRDHLHVVFLAGTFDHPRNTLRAQLSGGLLDAVRIGHQTISFDGPSRLAQAVTAIVMGDFVSAYVGILYGLDPTPVDAIGRLKANLAAAAVDPA